MINFYDYSPWLTISVYRQYMCITALEHEDNVYPTGEKYYWRGEEQKNVLKQIRHFFENQILPVKYGKIIVMTSPYTKTFIPWPQQETKNNE